MFLSESESGDRKAKPSHAGSSSFPWLRQLCREGIDAGEAEEKEIAGGEKRKDRAIVILGVGGGCSIYRF